MIFIANDKNGERILAEKDSPRLASRFRIRTDPPVLGRQAIDEEDMPTVLAYTDDPNLLKIAIRDKMPQLRTWRIESGDLRHVTAQYVDIGYFTIAKKSDHVVFAHAFFTNCGVARHERPAKSAQMQGHLVSMLLTHFYDLISSVTVNN